MSDDDDPMTATEVMIRRELPYTSWVHRHVLSTNDTLSNWLADNDKTRSFVDRLRQRTGLPLAGLEEAVGGLSVRELTHLLHAAHSIA